jgi:hypothetical protein
MAYPLLFNWQTTGGKNLKTLKNIKSTIPIIEKRRWPRHLLSVPVSFKASDAGTMDRTWHIGKTQDVSLEGMQVISSRGVDLLSSSRLEILIFPARDGDFTYIADPEPVAMTGSVVWQNTETRSIGIRLDD